VTGWETSERVLKSGGFESRQRVLVAEPAVEASEAGARTLGVTYWQAVDRPNLMIKIPGTPEGLMAVEQALYDGINVNVTLLFAVSAYEHVMEAFIRAMERRHVEGLPLDRHSVASFFVSRVDTEVDRRLDANGHTHLAGRAGVANARAAYQAFKRVFEGERFAALRAAGCPVQRPLWASTGVKNPAYSETLYVDELVAPHTVNTMPLPARIGVRWSVPVIRHWNHFSRSALARHSLVKPRPNATTASATG